MKNGQRLTDKLVHGLPTPPAGARITYDSELSGFGARITAAGARAYVLNYRINGRERRFTIGDANAWKCSPARAEAARLKAKVRLGGDPLEALQRARGEPTMGDLCDVFEAEFLPRLRAATVKQYMSAIDGSATRPAIRRHFRHKRVAEVSHHDVEEFHRLVSRTAPTMANRALAVLSRMFGAAIRRGWRTDNPVRGTERNQETKRTRYLSPAEIARLTTALADLADQQAANIFRLLLLTGARRGEVQAMRWEQLDLGAGVWVKPGSTTKQKTEHRVPLSAPALQLLVGIERAGEYVFPGRDGEGHRVEIKAQWANVCKAAELSAVHMHDLRHTYASVLASAGLSLPVIGALLGHSQPATTARYAHLLDDPLRAATERVGVIVTGGAAGDVVELRR